MKSLILCTDAYGGRGGIALYNRNFIRAVSEHPGMEEVVVVPRKIYYKLEKIPENVVHFRAASKNKLIYILSAIFLCFRKRSIDIIFCTHLHLLPVAMLCKLRFGCRVHLLVFGRDAWQKSNSKLANYFVKRLTSFISMRHFTARSLIKWAKLKDVDYFYLPNCIDPSNFGIKSNHRPLLKRYGLEDSVVIISAGRLDVDDQRKGIDEVLESLPMIRKAIRNVKYLIIGDGEDRERLEKKTADLGVVDIVTFTGYIPEEDKADYFGLGHVFAMPGSNPIFDRYPFRFVFLEALACGLKVIGSKLQDQWEIDDPDSSLIIQVDPNDQNEISSAIINALAAKEKAIHPRLKHFYYESYKELVNNIINKSLSKCSDRLLK